MTSIRYSIFVVALVGAFLLFKPFVRLLGFLMIHHFVQTSGSHFHLYGFNSYGMLSVASDPTQRFKVSNVFCEPLAEGLAVCRTWAFSDGEDQTLQVSPGVYNENVFQALDFVVGEAQKYGVKLILSLVNNYNDYGGKPQYVQWARNARTSVNNDDDFYTIPVVKDYY